MQRRGFICLLAATLAMAAAAPGWRELNAAAGAAIKAGDFAKLHSTLVQLKPLMPGNPRVAYNLAASSARLGNTAAALEELGHWAGMGLVYDIGSDDDFTSLRALPVFTAIQHQVEANRKVVSRSSAAFSISEPDLIPEDIAWDANTKRFFISSVRQAKIITGDGQEFARTPWSALALRADVKHRILWVATGWTPHCAACDPNGKDKTALLAFDLDNGRLRQRIESPVKGLLGDMTLSSKGDIFVTEGIYGAVLHLKPGASTFERLDEPGEFPSPQTPALSRDEKTLYIPDYARGIAAMNLTTRTVTWTQPADNIALSGIDGLYAYRGGFLAVQNGTSPPRVMQFSTSLKTQEVLEANGPYLGEPTHGTVANRTFYFLANTGWGEYDGEGKKKPGSAPVVSTVRSLRLP